MFMPRCTRGPVQGIRWPVQIPSRQQRLKSCRQVPGSSFPSKPFHCYIGEMKEPKPTYVVTVLYKPEGQQPYWKTLLSTGDLEKANALIESLKQDGVNAKYEVILPRKPKR